MMDEKPNAKNQSPPSPKHVVVIGAGASGLPAIKTALEYGFSVVCLERKHDIGGLWRYKTNPDEDEGTVMYSTVINTSKEMTAYSDFPPPNEYPNYMHNRQMLQYLRDYADHFKLSQYIKFGQKVLSVDRTPDFDQTGQWEVTYEDETDGQVHKEMFDGVLLCTGHHSIPSWPTPFPGQENFKGGIIHSHNYHSSAPFADKKVVVVGIGNSGGDIAVELSKISKDVQLSTRSGSWVLNRVWDYGEPSDLAYLNRFTWFLKGLTPASWQNYFLEKKVSRRFDHGRFGLTPKHRFLEAHVTINDELPNRISAGTVVIRPNVASFGETSLTFEDGTTVEDVDYVIFATGYRFAFDVVEGGKLIPVYENKVELYKFMLPPQLAPHNTLAIIGLIQPMGSIMPISEMQCRVYCAALSGEASLPAPKAMWASTKKTNADNQKRYLDRPRHTIQVYYMTYMESLASLIGIKPRIKKYWFTDFNLAKKLVFHGMYPYQYRLDGPHAWPGARAAILGADQRAFECTRTRRTPETLRSTPVSKCYIKNLICP